MTEAEWLSCQRPLEMLSALRGKVSDRKLRLFAVACCRRATPLLPPELRQALRVAELFADGQASDAGRKAARGAVMAAGRAGFGAGTAKDAVAQALCRKAQDAARFAVTPAGGLATVWAWTVATQRPPGQMPAYGTDGWEALAALRAAEGAAQCDLLRDVIGNPFGPRPLLDPAWLAWGGGTAGRLALAILRERAFDHLPVLADALEEAGCVDDALTRHCRQPGEHVPGCWALDVLLGKA
jgi:hypothetical protein